jgi:hypothetical protein
MYSSKRMCQEGERFRSVWVGLGPFFSRFNRPGELSEPLPSTGAPTAT